MAAAKGGRRVIDIDRGMKELMRRVAGKHRMRVGVFGDLAAQKAIDGNGATVGEIASAHEFSIPAGEGRRWLRSTLEGDKAQIETAIRRAAQAVILRSMPSDQALTLLGLGIVGLIKKRIVGGLPPGLSQNYLPRKLAKYPGATTPLIASGQFLGSIISEVEEVPGGGAKRGGGKRGAGKARKAKAARKRQIRALKRGFKIARRAAKKISRKGAKQARRGLKAAKRQLRAARRVIKRAPRAIRKAIKFGRKRGRK